MIPRIAPGDDAFGDRIDVGADVALPLREADLRRDALDPFLVETRDHLGDRRPAQAGVHDLVERAQLFRPAAAVIEIEGDGGEQRMDAVVRGRVTFAQGLAILFTACGATAASKASRLSK